MGDGVKRYDCTNGGQSYCYGCYEMTDREDGDYVSWDDHQRVVAGLRETIAFANGGVADALDEAEKRAESAERRLAVADGLLRRYRGSINTGHIDIDVDAYFNEGAR